VQSLVVCFVFVSFPPHTQSFFCFDSKSSPVSIFNSIDAWVKCTALAHDYHYEQPPESSNNPNNNTTMRQEREDYAEWKRSQAAKADALTRRAATRAKQLLNLMIRLGHYDPERHNVTSTSDNGADDDNGVGREASLFNVDKCEPGMRPNCYTYSAVMNALAKSCSALRVMSSSGNTNSDNQSNYRDRGGMVRELRYDPAREAQDMLESMIEKHERYKERVGETDIWKNSGYARTSPHDDDWLLEDADDEEIGLEEDYDDDYIGSNSSYQRWMKESSPSSTSDGEANSHWFEPRPDELTFPPNTINYNSVLNAWSRASRYDPYSALRAEKILLERMERPLSEGGDAVEPDALSYSLVIHAWLRGCRGSTGLGPPPSLFRPRKRNFTDEERIYKAIEIVDRLEIWARKAHAHRMVGNGRSDRDGSRGGDNFEYDDDYSEEDEPVDNKHSFSRSSSYTFRQHNKARDLDVEVYNSILVAFSREQGGDHAASVMKLLDRMERIADELDMPSVRPNQRSYNVALDVIAKSAMITNTSLSGYYYKDKKQSRDNKQPGHHFNPLFAGRAAESILSRMLARDFRPDAYTFASVLNTYQRIPNGKLDAALAADAVVRGMESLHLHGKIDQPPDVFHYTMVCACWSRSGEQGVAGERCSEILRHMQQRDKAGFPRVRPNIRTFNAVIDSHAYNGRVAEAEDMLLSMVDNYESSAARSMDGIEDEELPVRPDSFSFNTVIQQWARTRTPEGGRRAELILERMLKFHHAGNADVRPDERSFSYIIYHYTKGAGRLAPDAPDRALKLLRKMIGMYRQGYTDLMPSQQNRTNPIFAFTSVIDAHSVLRRNDSGLVGAELLESMTKLGEKIDSLRPNTYACLSVLYGWSSCGAIDAGERATELLQTMEADMKAAASRGEESIMRTTQRCYILAQTAWARSQSERKAAGALGVLNMMEKNYAEQNLDAKPTVQAYSMVLNACAFADSVEVDGKVVKASPEQQMKAFEIAELIMDRLGNEPYPNVKSTSMTYGTFIKCCGRLDLPDNIAQESASRAFADCCRTGYVSDFVFTQLRYALPPEEFLNVLVKNGYKNLNSKGKSLSRDGKRIRPVRLDDLPEEWKRSVDRSAKRSNR
jgi:pentatricopeptide repeat protein